LLSPGPVVGAAVADGETVGSVMVAVGAGLGVGLTDADGVSIEEAVGTVEGRSPEGWQPRSTARAMEIPYAVPVRRNACAPAPDVRVLMFGSPVETYRATLPFQGG
jgi:hypothetical protein